MDEVHIDEIEVEATPGGGDERPATQLVVRCRRRRTNGVVGDVAATS